MTAHFTFLKNELSKDPYPRPNSNMITRHEDTSGRTVYQYLRSTFPLLIQYYVYESDVTGAPGFVWIARALDVRLLDRGGVVPPRPWPRDRARGNRRRRAAT